MNFKWLKNDHAYVIRDHIMIKLGGKGVCRPITSLGC